MFVKEEYSDDAYSNEIINNENMANRAIINKYPFLFIFFSFD